MFDFCIVGGGMVGATTALGLAQKGFSVALVETHLPEPFTTDDEPDMRVSAISVTSQLLLASLGAWQHIAHMRTCSYRRLSVWENITARTDFDCADIHADRLGYIVENRILQLGIHQALANLPNVTWFTKSDITMIDTGHASHRFPEIHFADKSLLTCKWIIGADGLHSKVRSAANIGTQGWQYRQQALAIQVVTHAAPQDITWQQFIPSGPVAFLPMYEQFASLVWYNTNDNIRRLKALSPSALKQEIKQAFPDELVDFDVLKTAHFPLMRMHANQYVKNNVVLVGDAAHAINPLAGQGVNLGFKDVAALLDCIDGRSPSVDCMHKYEAKRRRDNLLMMSAMDAIYGTFKQSNPLIKTLRNLGLTLANNGGPIKHQVMKYAMGLR
ncbi:2-octaprenyl-3-methyl-6-methoxy-1,4-benzoquinol hydroxylase [Paraglaciecola mesophila]|uniref:2-octaprenyl-3-methyl-6-methoxy-1,4-benzoquinol hydroxylase n=1 Tax=Paraglaciecola mesophila TaxID=197222 RepID=A0A857JEY3_9ALTE|nr:FAD-dependent oxidoreductase [Paraglaciecola mesophila]QHJ09802.1 2-octaprenyl-3-methyl-6-methoxy-1,4-benzoquinol hydroxylase [Paraglaciecola mesophila]